MAHKVLHDLAHCLSLLTPLTYLIACYVTNDRKLVIIFWTQLADSHFCALEQAISSTWNVLPMNVRKENAYIRLKSQLQLPSLYNLILQGVPHSSKHFVHFLLAHFLHLRAGVCYYLSPVNLHLLKAGNYLFIF